MFLRDGFDEPGLDDEIRGSQPAEDTASLGMGAGTSSGRGVARARGSGDLGEEGADQQVETGHLHPLLGPINTLVRPATVYILSGHIC